MSCAHCGLIDAIALCAGCSRLLVVNHDYSVMVLMSLDAAESKYWGHQVDFRSETNYDKLVKITRRQFYPWCVDYRQILRVERFRVR